MESGLFMKVFGKFQVLNGARKNTNVLVMHVFVVRVYKVFCHFSKWNLAEQEFTFFFLIDHI